MDLIVEIFNMLNRKADYAVARNHEGLPNKCSSRDIDIIIARKVYDSIKKEIKEIAIKCDYKILLVSESDRFDSVFFQKNNNVIQFDFFFGIVVQGVILLSADEMLEKKLFDGNVYYLPEYLQFLEKYVFNVMVGQKYPEKYNRIREKVLDDEYDLVKQYLRIMFGDKVTSTNDMETSSCKQLKKYARESSKRRYGVHYYINSFRYLKLLIINMIKPRGLFISFTGPDGVGKTTVLDMLVDTYRCVWAGESVLVHHFRPDVIPRIAELLHKTGAVKEVDVDYSNPHRGKNRGIIGSCIRLSYYMFDYWLGYWRLIFPRRYRRQVTIYDRYYSDLIIDSKRSNISLPYKFVYAVGKMIPQPEYRILLSANTETILKRKQELSQKEINSIKCKMEWLNTNNKKYILITNEGTAEETVLKILNSILDKQNQKYEGYFR